MYLISRCCFLPILSIWSPFNKRHLDYQKWKLREKTNIHFNLDARYFPDKRDGRYFPDKRDARNVPDKRDARNVPDKRDARNVPDKRDARNVPDDRDAKKFSCISYRDGVFFQYYLFEVLLIKDI